MSNAITLKKTLEKAVKSVEDAKKTTISRGVKIATIKKEIKVIVVYPFSI